MSVILTTFSWLAAMTSSGTTEVNFVNMMKFPFQFIIGLHHISKGVVFYDFDCLRFHYSDVIRSTTMASQVIGILIICSNVSSGTHQRKHKSSPSLAFVRGIHRWPVDSPPKRPVTPKNVSIWWRHVGHGQEITSHSLVQMKSFILTFMESLAKLLSKSGHRW